jgi:hypothetical protein
VDYDLCQNCFDSHAHDCHQMILMTQSEIKKFEVGDYDMQEALG